jgi:hypothetical protein
MIDVMQAAINALEGLNHKVVPPSAENWDPVCDTMEAEGYTFYCAPAADETGREPEPGFRM